MRISSIAWQGDVGPHGDDVGARHHDVVGGGLPQAQHVGDQQAFLAVEFRLLAGDLLRLGGFLHQFGDESRSECSVVLAPEEMASRLSRLRVCRSWRFQGLGTPMPRRIRTSPFPSARVAGMVVILALQMQRAMHHQMGQMVRRPAALAPPPRARTTPSARMIPAPGCS